VPLKETGLSSVLHKLSLDSLNTRSTDYFVVQKHEVKGGLERPPFFSLKNFIINLKSVVDLAQGEGSYL